MCDQRIMQSGKNAIESAKEAAANVGASAKSGMEKTKATLQEKVINIFSHNTFRLLTFVILPLNIFVYEA